jgi:hypothetical protein
MTKKSSEIGSSSPGKYKGVLYCGTNPTMDRNNSLLNNSRMWFTRNPYKIVNQTERCRYLLKASYVDSGPAGAINKSVLKLPNS